MSRCFRVYLFDEIYESFSKVCVFALQEMFSQLNFEANSAYLLLKNSNYALYVFLKAVHLYDIRLKHIFFSIFYSDADNFFFTYLYLIKQCSIKLLHKVEILKV